MEMEDLEEFMIPKEAMEKLNDPELLRRYIEEGKTFQDILGYKQESMDKFYDVACNLYRNHRYKSASDAFLFLTTLNPYVPEYWLGQGMCEQVNEEYKQALVAYSMAILGDRDMPVAHYHSAACHNGLGDVHAALACLERTLLICGDKEQHAAIKVQAQRSKDLLNARKKPS